MDNELEEGGRLRDTLCASQATVYLHFVLWLVFARKHGEGNSDTRRICLVDHCWVARCSSRETRAGLRGEIHDLASPAETQDSPLVNRGTLRLDLVEDLGNTLERFGWCSCGLEMLSA